MAWTLGTVIMLRDMLASLTISLTPPGMCPSPSTSRRLKPPPPTSIKSRHHCLLPPTPIKPCPHQPCLQLPTGTKPCHLHHCCLPSHGPHTLPLPFQPCNCSPPTAPPLSFGHTNILKDAHSAYSLTTASGCARSPANMCTWVAQKSSMTSYDCLMNSASPTMALGRESRQVL